MVHTFIDNSKWIPIHSLPGFECCIEYYVSSEGDVKSTKGGDERLLKHKIKRNGYRMVNLTQRIGRGKIISAYVHRLVGLAFLGVPPTPMGRGATNSMLQFKDGNRLNCSADNLRWVKVADKNKPLVTSG